MLRQSEVKMLVSAESFKTSDYRGDGRRGRGDLPAWGRSFTWARRAGTRCGAAGRRGRAGRPREAGLAFDDPINIQYTSGTTGFPKGATLSHHNILNNGFFIGAGCGYTEQDRVCIPVPFYHCFGMVLGNLACTTHGAVHRDPGARASTRPRRWRTVQAERCTSLYGVPTMFIAELALPDFADYDLSTLRTGIMAGSPCPVEVMKRVISEMHMTEVTICYGMTETLPVSTQTTADDDMERRVSTVGRVHPHVEVKVIDPETGRVLPRGEPGELCTRGYSVMLGYWDEPEKTAEVIDPAAGCTPVTWPVMDEAGDLNIVGRIKDMVIRGGENVYPREVEEFLYTHPDDRGRPGDRGAGREVRRGAMRLGQAAAGRRADRGRRCGSTAQGKIAHYKIPRYVQFTDDFPMTVTGKVQKYKMREASIGDLGLKGASQTRTAYKTAVFLRPVSGVCGRLPVKSWRPVTARVTPSPLSWPGGPRRRPARAAGASGRTRPTPSLAARPQQLSEVRPITIDTALRISIWARTCPAGGSHELPAAPRRRGSPPWGS